MYTVIIYERYDFQQPFFFPPVKQFVFVFVFAVDAGYETYLLLNMTVNTKIQNHNVFCYYVTFSYITVVSSIVGGHHLPFVDIRLAIRNTGISVNI